MGSEANTRPGECLRPAEVSSGSRRHLQAFEL